MANDQYLQPDAPDPVLDEAFIVDLVRQFVPAAQAVTAVDESGGEARTYAIDDQVILKTQRPHRLRPRTSLEREVVFLRHLAAFPHIPVPRVLGYGRSGNVEYTCMTRMPGAAVQRLMVTGAARTTLLQNLGRVLAQLHAIPQAALHAEAQFPGDRTAADLHTRLAAAFADALAQLARAGVDWQLPMTPDQIAARALQALPSTTTFVALHSNPGPEHTFADPATSAYVGTIDFGDAYVSHPALDLRRWRAPADRAALLAGYRAEQPVSKEFMQIWQVTQILANLSTIATAPDERNAAYVHLEHLVSV